MSDLLDGIQREMRARLDELRPLVSEYEHLRRAMAALEGVPSAQESSVPKPRAGSAPRRKRAPAGTNRELVLAAVRGNPGASASHIAEASGVQRTVVYGILRRLSDDGVIDKRVDPETGTGYGLASAEEGDHSATDAPTQGGQPASDAGSQDSDAPD